MPKDARRDNFGTVVIYTEEDGQCKTIDTAHRKVNLDDDTESWSWSSNHAVSWKRVGWVDMYLSVCLVQ